MKRRIIVFSLILLGCLSFSAALAEGEAPVFREASVHDPSIIRADDGYFYIYGSHMAAARTKDLMQWETISTNAGYGCKLVVNVQEEMGEALNWAQTNTFWAPDVRQLNDGRYYMYYCCCRGDSPLSTLGAAVSDRPEGPFKNLGIILKSGMDGISEDGTRYDATNHPNAVDPNVFFDREGKLWMVYGSYSGGIYILQMDPDTGFPFPDQGYGKKLLGRNHSRIEGPYILYAPKTDYYYLFLSFGGLDVNGGYNIRVCRSKNPDGPYMDALGQDMINCGGLSGSFFDDKAIEGYGVKLMGGFLFMPSGGEANSVTAAYRSPGHNSAYYDAETDRYFLVFHTRFAGMGDLHNVRVHQFYFNTDGWPVVSPYRYAGETAAASTEDEQAGEYKVIFHLRDINVKQHESVKMALLEDGSVQGAQTGAWKSLNGRDMEIMLDGITYKGVFAGAFDSQQRKWTMTFTTLSSDGAALWGSRSAAP
jgi:arabinan endo-1,5-alpha-L-arabinosidase